MRFTWQPAGVGGGTRRSRRRLLQRRRLAAVARLPPRTANRCVRKRAYRRKERCCRRRERLTSINACECSRSAEVSGCRSLARPLVRSYVPNRSWIAVTVIVRVVAHHDRRFRRRGRRSFAPPLAFGIVRCPINPLPPRRRRAPLRPRGKPSARELALGRVDRPRNKVNRHSC